MRKSPGECALLRFTALCVPSFKNELRPRGHARRRQNVLIKSRLVPIKTDGSYSEHFLRAPLIPLTSAALLCLQLKYSASTRGVMATSEPRATEGEQDPNSDNLRPPSSSRSLPFCAPHEPFPLSPRRGQSVPLLLLLLCCLAQRHLRTGIICFALHEGLGGRQGWGSGLGPG